MSKTPAVLFLTLEVVEVTLASMVGYWWQVHHLWGQFFSGTRSKWVQRKWLRWLTPKWVSKSPAVLEYGYIITSALLIRIGSCFFSARKPFAKAQLHLVLDGSSVWISIWELFVLAWISLASGLSLQYISKGNAYLGSSATKLSGRLLADANVGSGDYHYLPGKLHVCSPNSSSKELPNG